MGDGTGRRPGRLWQLISRQAARPSGLVGRVIGRVMVKDTRSTNEVALELLAPELGDRILEIGFGQGRTVGRLVELGATVVGVEVSDTMRAQARARNRRAVEAGTVELLIGDGIRLPLDDQSVDGALTAHTIYFWPDPELTLGEVRRVLRPRGRFVIGFRAGDEDAPARLDPEVYDFPTTDTVVDRLRAAGFGAIETTRRPDIDPAYRWIVAHAAG